MAKKLISYDNQKTGLGLPDVVETALNATYVRPDIGDARWALKEELQTRPVSDQIGRFTASLDPAARPSQDGEVLFILKPPPTLFFTDFSDYTVGETPHDWSLPWVGENHLSVVEDADASNGVLLREDYASVAGQNRLISWDSIGQHADAEAVMKWRASSIAAPAQLALRASGGLPRAAYHGGVQNRTVSVLQRLVASTSSDVIDRADATFSSGAWYITRMRAVGDRVAVKTWPASDPEPAAWEFEATDTNIPDAGLVGFRVFPTSGIRDIDWFGVALGGQTAPMEPVQ